MNQYDVIIIGAGPAGAFTAYELLLKKPNLNILMLEKGKSIEKRVCPKRTTKKCVGCSPCRITTGFAGAGAYSDGKLSLSPDVGGTLSDMVGFEQAQELINYVDSIYLSFGADTNVYGNESNEIIDDIRQKAISSNLKFIECPIRHLGTEEGYRIYYELQKLLEEKGVNFLFDTMVDDIIIENNRAIGVKTKSASYYAPVIVSSVGREGSSWFFNQCKQHNIKTAVGTVDIGVRVEVRDEIMKVLNETLYESKFIHYTKTFDDKVRVFCSNPSGEVATEYYKDNMAVVNGHAYKSKDLKTNNTNFALLVSMNFTEPFNDPIAYGEYVARLANLLTDNKIVVQRYGDFKRGRRTTKERLSRNNIVPTLKDAVPGDLSLVLPYRILKDIDEMILALDGVSPGLASDELLLYGVEVKFYNNKLILDDNCKTSVDGLYAIGDGAGITRGLAQASAMGVYLARKLNF